jgi:hypothetical protein
VWPRKSLPSDESNQLQNRKRFYERAVKKKVSPRPPKVLGS